MKIYLICTWYEVGIRHYTHNLLYNLQNYLPDEYELYVTLVLRNKADKYDELKLTNKVNLEVIVLESAAKNNFYKIFPGAMDDIFINKAQKIKPDLTFILFDGVYFTKIDKLKSISKILYTIHDLIPHETAANDLKGIILRYLETKRRAHLLKTTENIITNSLPQFTALQKSYPEKKIYFAHIPTFVTINMVNGNIKPDEIEGIDSYILFFGRLEKYKGIEELISTHAESNIKHKLVVAGSGKLWFDVPADDRIIIINRYIKDEEVKALYDNCVLNVMPYTSVTQTSMMSIPFYFKSPVIFSDLPEFDEVGRNTGCMLCDFNNTANYETDIEKYYNNEFFRSQLIKKQTQYYNNYFDRAAFANSMKKCFNDIVNPNHVYTGLL